MVRVSRFRTSEWIFLAYFAYVAAISWMFRVGGGVRWRTAFVAAGVFGIFVIFAGGKNRVMRDWLPIALVLLAYREMDWFTPATKTHDLERAWVAWDQRMLHDWGVQRAIESLGPLLPGYLELCYLLVYGVGFYCLGVLYGTKHPERADRFLSVYALGGLLSYALFPYFPSDPPRVVFGWIDMPNIVTPIRQLNLYLVNSYGIHSSVFPSAHVSTGFAAAWGLRHTLPEKPWYGRAVLIYAVSMTIATFYGRYHYAVDALAGIGVAAVAILIVRRLQR